MASPPKKRRPALPGGRRTADHFWRAGCEYYVSGRQSFLARVGYTAGNIFHHAIEFMLKGQLAIKEDYRNFFQDYGHDLGRAWAAVKKEFPDHDLSGFDQFIETLDEFEDIRYPDLIIEQGGLLSVGTGAPPRQMGPGAPLQQFHVNVRDVDALMAKMFQLFSMNPVCYLPMSEAARDAVREDNTSTKDSWFQA